MKSHFSLQNLLIHSDCVNCQSIGVSKVLPVTSWCLDTSLFTSSKTIVLRLTFAKSCLFYFICKIKPPLSNSYVTVLEMLVFDAKSGQHDDDHKPISGIPGGSSAL